MAYSLSATKLQHYARCPRAYYYRYEHGLKDAAAFGSAALGNALHRALAKIYQDWHYQEPIPPLDWLRRCWEEQCSGLSEKQVEEGWQILDGYYEREILAAGVMKRPIALEGRIEGSLIVEGIEFKLIGRYDRLDALAPPEGGLTLIDYKSAKEPVLPMSETLDLQLGLYYLALEQRYDQALRSMSLLFLRRGERVTFEASVEHKRQVEAVVGQLALKLRQEEDWQPQCGEVCGSCTYRKYCPAYCEEQGEAPEPLPERVGTRRGLQLSLGV